MAHMDPRVQEHASLERAQQIFEKRKEGKSFRQIAREMGLSHSGAGKIFAKWMEQARDATLEAAQYARDLELERLDELWQLNYERACARALDPEDQARATRNCLAIMERRSKLLGLDAPEKHEHTGKDGTPLLVEVMSLTGEQLDQELAGFFDPGYMAGAADGFKAGQEKAAEPKKKRARKKPQGKAKAKVRPKAKRAAAEPKPQGEAARVAQPQDQRHYDNGRART